MKNNQFYKSLTFAVLFGLMIAFMSCDKDKESNENLTIEEIVLNPESYYGKTVTLEGKYGGWSDNSLCDYENIAIKMRSDVFIYDETGCIYMTGDYQILYKEIELNPTDTSCLGSKIEIRAIVSLFDGKPILGDFED